MNSLAIIAFVSCLAVANAGVWGSSGAIVQGPSAKSTIVGADGSVISSVAPGGTIISEEHPGVVAHTAHVAPVVAAPVIAAYSAPHLAAHSYVATHSAPIVSAHSAYLTNAYSAPLVSAHATPVVAAYTAPVVGHGVVGHSQVDTIVAGPSGTIATSKTVAAPAVVAGHLSYGVHGVHF